MYQRMISGITGAILVIAILLFNEKFLFLINIIIALIAILSMTELFAAMEITNLFCITIPSLLFVPVMPIIGGNSLFWQLCLFIYTIIMLGVMVLNTKLKLKDVALVYMMAIIITFSLSKIVEIRNCGGKFGSFYLLLTLCIAWLSDTGAYFCGKYLGKTKLCPEVSPKKTVEGVIGGIIICVMSLLLIGFLFNYFIFKDGHKISYLMLTIMGLIGSPISALGDLCFSVIKRNCNVKDFGNVIPGHGGILDRFDSVIFVSPYVYLFLKFLLII